MLEVIPFPPFPLLFPFSSFVCIKVYLTALYLSCHRYSSPFSLLPFQYSSTFSSFFLFSVLISFLFSPSPFLIPFPLSLSHFLISFPLSPSPVLIPFLFPAPFLIPFPLSSFFLPHPLPSFPLPFSTPPQHAPFLTPFRLSRSLSHSLPSFPFPSSYVLSLHI